MTVAAFLVLFTLECSVILLYLSLQVYRRKTILGQYYFWMILFLLSLICLLLGIENIGELYPELGPSTQQSDTYQRYGLTDFSTTKALMTLSSLNNS